MTPPWREATREELHTYYVETFPGVVDSLPAFITATGPKQYAIAFRDPYPVRSDETPDRDFIRRDTWDTATDGSRTVPRFGSLESVVDFIQHPAGADPVQTSGYGLADPTIVEKAPPRPDAVYFALDHWERPWVLAVDIDAKDIAAGRVASEAPEGSSAPEASPSQLEAAGIFEQPPSGYPYAYADIEQALEYGFTVQDIFREAFGATETLVVYSGQGCHVYLLDTDRLHRYDEQSREVINDLLLEEYGIPIDPVVTADRRRVMRLPYSLHADICRVVQPIESPDFDFRTEACPPFLDL